MTEFAHCDTVCTLFFVSQQKIAADEIGHYHKNVIIYIGAVVWPISYAAQIAPTARCPICEKYFTALKVWEF